MKKAQDGKRKRVEIDLTGDSDDDQPAFKLPRAFSDKNTQPSSSQNQRSQGASAYQTPPLSSATTSSQSSFPSSIRYESAYYSSRIPADSQHSQTERESWLADDDEDVNEIIGTQSGAFDGEQLFHYGDLPTKIVGCRYYNVCTVQRGLNFSTYADLYE